jgi:hypothetical protein
MRHLVFVYSLSLSLLFSLAAVAQNVPVPFISVPLSPATVAPGSPGFTLTVLGSNFTPSAVMLWNGSQRPTVVISGAELQAPVYASDLTTAGYAVVTVENLGNNPQTSSPALFTIRDSEAAVAFAPVSYFTGSGDVGALGDFNGDGIPDVVTCDSGQRVINVYLAQAWNKFGPAITTVANDVAGCNGLFTGDFNGDHLLDLLVVNSGGVDVWFGDGKGKFTKGPSTRLGTYNNTTKVFAVADVDGDGILDLCGVSTDRYNRGAVVFIFGTGDGKFGPGVSPPIAKVSGNPVLGDFNEDGLLDVAVEGNGSKGGFTISLNQGNRTFGRNGRYSTTCLGYATADVNHDGHLDIVDCGGAVLLGKGNGGFTYGYNSKYTGGGSLPIIADVNGDGNMDLLFLGTSSLELLLGNGDGTFQPATPAGPAFPSFYGWSGFDPDGRLAFLGNIPEYDGSGITFFRQVAAGLYPGILTYSAQLVGTTSPPQTANFYNAGASPLDLTGIQITGSDPNDFSQTNNCPNSIPVGGSCQIQVTFTPTAAGTRQATLSVAYKGVSSPQSVVLTGQGLPGISVSLLPPSLTYALRLVNTSSTPQTATLTNTGSGDVTVSSIGISGEFTQTNNCPGTLAVGQSCQIQVTFSPTQKGQSNGTLSVTDSAPNSPQTVALSGVGTILVFKPIGVNFGNQQVGTNSEPAAFNFINEGTVALSISSISFAGADPQDFSQTNNCPSSLPAGSHCTIEVTFTPTQKGARSATLQVFDDAIPSPQTAGVGGTGT